MSRSANLTKYMNLLYMYVSESVCAGGDMAHTGAAVSQHKHGVCSCLHIIILQRRDPNYHGIIRVQRRISIIMAGHDQNGMCSLCKRYLDRSSEQSLWRCRH